MDTKIFDDAVKAVESTKDLSKEKMDQAKEAINKEKQRISMYVAELKKRGMESQVYKFVEKCLGTLREFLYTVLGKCKELYAYVCALLAKCIPSKQTEMKV